ncbi:serine hydrolase [Bradyrhizobium sp. U87765 SZCCT0131]|uniref:serine hydrolase n=1 Tax=unclassified Bradyrhizobium TaxID=2631580 RepID=UPI001BA9FB84|nr:MULTISPECIES: serine hydrolase [unclassified Bradyrhizobium]MBR1219357.1 serine hydrolase [Bradyrhizobium sp. U87765 SZCCT0131]MBR1262008.1 serine hydrolase [Bradyrhizobium sp. U87765 SZCCT0134]MBR1306139.1 serine hydrolase [Bradyrhizobium sp. U87765 SZCCT0110]MBR1317790.1 serine hydrolase [Bradyrhizobium sp. U87765 SZCCT0109]MBR1351492.1 serine hydrolase [Bradyrhizobium sp. U87765 SZCCT0048]
MLVHRVDELRLARGMVVGTTEANERSFVSHGRRNSVCDDPVQPDTVFELGSITKLFTVLLLANMMQRGEAELNEPVAHLLPAGTRVPCRNGREITLCDLAAHRSGLPLRPTNLQPSDRDDPYARYTADQLYEFLGTHELLLTPGDVYTYSNVGTGLLGYALARRAASRDYETLLRERILAPLGMNDTVIGLPPRLAQRLASPHNSSLDATPLWNFDVLAGAGALRSTAIDMLTFLEAIADAHSPVGGMVSSVIASRDEGGMGLGAPHPDGGTTIAHAGGTGGSRSSIRYIPQWKRGVVVLSNSNVDAVIDLGVHILDTRYSPLWFRKEVPVEPSVFTRLIGSYQISPGRTLEVTNPDGRLFVRHTSEATRVFPSSEWQYFYKALNAQITFEPGSDGRAARLVLHESGSDQIAIRVA